MPEMSYQVFHGSIEVVCGPMFSGKTSELIRRVERAQIAKQRVQIFKPSIDIRYNKEDVVSHTSRTVKAEPVENAVDILIRLKDSTRVVAIDEVQFFDEAITTVVVKLAARGYRVICAGLDLDYRAQPFGPMPSLLAVADEVMKIHAICTICGASASRTQRLIKSKSQVLLGETDAYEARCRAHYQCDEDEEQTLLPLQEEIVPLASNLAN
jgi:thymidine kinase